jgi:pyruvate kinase
MRHTKIVATVGPSSSSSDSLDALIRAGVDVFRLNFSHGTHASHAETFQRIRDASGRIGRHVAILQDLSGPKIRTGSLEGGVPLRLTPGDELRIIAGDAVGRQGCVGTSYTELVRSAHPGDRLLLDDGRIELRVTRSTPSELTTVVVHGGELGEHKGINAPGVALPASAMTEKDAGDLEFGLHLGVDLVALSFVQTPDDIERARTRMEACGRTVPIVAKIERPAAVQNLPGILEIAQGVMVARGDLGLEMPLEQVPRVQKEIIRRARELGRPVIVATQVLESMRVQPRPTRAEVSDAANAVDDGVDAIMLAGETAVGAYPVRAVETLDAVIRDAETLPSAKVVPVTRESAGNLHARALCEAAVTLATTGQADAIVAVTRGGTTARLLSALRPVAPIYAATSHLETAGALALFWGVQSIVTAERDPERLESLMLEQGVIRHGAVVVFVSISAELGRRESNFLNVQRIGM